MTRIYQRETRVSLKVKLIKYRDGQNRTPHVESFLMTTTINYKCGNMLAAHASECIWMINTVEKHHKISKRAFKMKRRVFWKARVWKSVLHMVSCMLWEHLTSVLTLRHFQHFNALLRRSTHFLHRRQNGVQCVYKSLLQPFIYLVESRNRAGTRGAHTRHILASFTEAHGEMTGDPTEGCTARQCTFREGLWNDETLPFVNHWRFHDHNGSIHRNGGGTATLNGLFFTLSPPDAQYAFDLCHSTNKLHINKDKKGSW